MSSTIRNKKVLLLHELSTDFVSIFPRSDDDSLRVGMWLDREMRNAVEFCLLKHVTFPEIRLSTFLISQQAYDKLEVEDFLKHAELLRNSR